MSSHSATMESTKGRFGERFIPRLKKQGVKEHAIRWYVIRAERCVDAFAGKRLRAHTLDDGTAYLESVAEGGGNGRLTDWQFRQMACAIQNSLARRLGSGLLSWLF